MWHGSGFWNKECILMINSYWFNQYFIFWFAYRVHSRHKRSRLSTISYLVWVLAIVLECLFFCSSNACSDLGVHFPFLFPDISTSTPTRCLYLQYITCILRFFLADDHPFSILAVEGYSLFLIYWLYRQYSPRCV